MVSENNLDLIFKPLTRDNWDDFEELFGSRGACGGCWCMSWRLKRSEFEKNKGEPNKQAMKSIVDSGEIPGIIAYHNDKPVGWCSVGPRENFSYLERSRIFAKVDNKPVWSIVCFFIEKNYRQQGVSLKIVKAAVEFARNSGAKIVEGYPSGPSSKKLPDAFAWNGLISTFEKAGFKTAIKRSEKRPLMRYYL